MFLHAFRPELGHSTRPTLLSHRFHRRFTLSLSLSLSPLPPNNHHPLSVVEPLLVTRSLTSQSQYHHHHHHRHSFPFDKVRKCTPFEARYRSQKYHYHVPIAARLRILHFTSSARTSASHSPSIFHQSTDQHQLSWSTQPDRHSEQTMRDVLHFHFSPVALTFLSIASHSRYLRADVAMTTRPQPLHMRYRISLLFSVTFWFLSNLSNIFRLRISGSPTVTASSNSIFNFNVLYHFSAFPHLAHDAKVDD
jgi:hypothetical protein